MRGLTIVVAGVDPARMRTALTMAAAQAALGGGATLFADGGAVSLLADIAPVGHEPALADLVETALELGVRIVACQTGLAASGIALSALAHRIEGGGLIGIMAALGEDRLVAL